MTITAKFVSRCVTCGQTIQPGTKIEWTKGSPVRHTSCVGSRTTASAPIYRRSSCSDHPRTGCSCGSREGMSRDSDCRSCRFEEEDN